MATFNKFNYEGNDISFYSGDSQVRVNATEMAKAFVKQPSDWLRLYSANSYISALSTVRGIPRTELVKVKQGGNNIQGTWMHEDVAIEFARWLSPTFAIWCNDRIKELLKHGATAINPEDLLNPDYVINIMTLLKSERAEKEILQETARQQSIELKQSAPKVEYYEKVLQSEGLITITVIAKDLGMTAQKLNKILHEQKVIFPVGSGKYVTWVLYQKYQDKGYTQTKTKTFTDDEGFERSHIHTYWTQLGRKAVIDFVNKLNSQKKQN